MKRFKVLFLVMFVMLFAVSSAMAAGTTSILDKNLRVYNVKPATNSFWDINKVKYNSDGFATFPIQQFLTTTTGSFVVYVLDNRNVDITGMTLDASFSWDAGTYKTRGEGSCPGAYVRFEFQDVTAGPYDSNDYWWSTGIAAPLAVDLNTVFSGELTASLTEVGRASWTNQAGKSATDTTPNWTDWTGSIVALSPYDGFTKAMKNAKQIGLSFGSQCAYASGVARDGASGIFILEDYNINP